MEKRPVKEIQKLIGGKIIGDQELLVSDVVPAEEAKEGTIIFVKTKKYIPSVFPHDILLITSEKLLSQIKEIPRAVLCVEDVELAFINLLKALYPTEYPQGISSHAFLSENIRLGKDVYIGEGVIIREGSVIEDGVKLFPGVYIGKNVKIGKDTVIYPYVVILDNVSIGSSCIIQTSSVLGGDGFGYAKVGEDYEKIPQVGKLIIEDRVEIGALCVIDRGALSDTIIKKGVKIDSFVKIAHNVIIGENSILTAQVGIAGSSKLGRNVVMGGQSGIADHVTVGDNVIIAADSGIISDIPSNSFVSGSPAIDHIQDYKAKALMYKLPELMKELKTLKKDVEKLKKKDLNNEQK